MLIHLAIHRDLVMKRENISHHKVLYSECIPSIIGPRRQ